MKMFDVWFPHVSRDGKLLFVPDEKGIPTYVIYSLPMSPWIPYWPWLAGGVVLVLMLSQGVRWGRFGRGRHKDGRKFGLT